MDYQFIGKALFLPKEKILVIGDLHIGYEAALIKSGFLAPKTQIKDLIQELRKTIEKTKPKKIIFVGDIEHSFGYEYQEKVNFREVMEFLIQYFKDKDIIFLKGNHDTIDYSFKGKMKNFYLKKDIAFIHGHKDFKEIHDKKIKTIILGHIHPSVEFKDEHTNKKEKYKCFLTGKSLRKNIIIVPSFLTYNEGAPVNNYDFQYEDSFSIIPKKDILKFKVHAIGENKIYDFGKVKDL